VYIFVVFFKKGVEIKMKITHEISSTSMVLRSNFCASKTSGKFHLHKNIEIIYLLSDGFKILIDGELIEGNKGDLIFVGEQTIHCFINETNNDIHMKLIHIALNVILSEQTVLKPIKTHIKAEEIAANPDFEKHLKALMDMMESVGRILDNQKNLFAKSIFSAFYFMLMEYFPGLENGNTLKKEKKMFFEILDYINEHFTENINVQSIASHMFITRGKVSDIFSKYSKMSINTYINNLRIAKANELLKNGYSVTEAALESGFQSVRTFNERYKASVGVAPKEYKKISK